MNNNQEDVYICPSFNIYSSEAEIALRVVGHRSSGAVGDVSDDDFEFDLVREDMAEEFFYNGQIQPVFPEFNHDLLKSNGESSTGSGEITLSQLFLKEDSVPEDIPVGA
ncbi:hypothetical protein ACS0TY_018258 [Phlomoides rotata]